MYFFTYQWDLPADTGFTLYGPVHLCWLGGIFLALVLLCRWYAGLPQKSQRRFSIALAWFAVGLLAFRYLILAVTGHLSVFMLPLHLCDLCPFLCLLFIYTRWNWVGQIVYGVCILAPLSALLFPDWTMYPQFNYMNLTAFLGHAALILFSLWQLIGRSIRPRFRYVWVPMVFLAALAPIIYWLNTLWGTNYFFLMVDSPDSPLTVLRDWFGRGGYLPAFAVMALIIIVLEFLPWIRRKGAGQDLKSTD